MGKDAGALAWCPSLIMTTVLGVDSQVLVTFSAQCGIEGFELRAVPEELKEEAFGCIHSAGKEEGRKEVNTRWHHEFSSGLNA